MTWVGVGIAGGALIGAIGSNLAANKQASGQLGAENMQYGMFNTILGQEEPFIQGGYSAETQLADLLGLNGPNASQQMMSTLENYPGYQFALQTGGQALTNAMTPGSGALSGQTLKSLMSFNQGLASTTFNSYVNNLLNMSQQGLNAAGNVAGSGTQLGTGAAQAAAGAAASQAGGIVGESNALGGGINMLGLLGYMNQSPGAASNWGGTPSSAGFSGAPLAGGS